MINVLLWALGTISTTIVVLSFVGFGRCCYLVATDERIDELREDVRLAELHGDDKAREEALSEDKKICRELLGEGMDWAFGGFFRLVTSLFHRVEGRWAALWASFFAFQKLALGKKDDAKLIEMKQHAAFLMNTPLSPYRFVATMAVGALMLVAAWGYWGWFVRLPVVEAQRDKAEGANQGWVDRAARAEAYSKRLREALDRQARAGEQSLAEFADREMTREAKRSAAAKRREKKRDAETANSDGGPEPYFIQWLRERSSTVEDGAAAAGSAAGKDAGAGAPGVLPNVPESRPEEPAPG